MRDTLEEYTHTGYGSINGDKVRNACYEAGLKAAVGSLLQQKSPSVTVAEVGPGADATLTHMAIRAAEEEWTRQKSCPALTIELIEGNSDSARKLRARLSRWAKEGGRLFTRLQRDWWGRQMARQC